MASFFLNCFNGYGSHLGKDINYDIWEFVSVISSKGSGSREPGYNYKLYLCILRYRYEGNT